MRFKLGIMATHPVQYQVPYFRALAAHPEIDVTVYYAMLPTPEQQGVGFGIDFAWDVPLLDGYKYQALHNVSRRPALSAFRGCDTPELAQIVTAAAFDAFLITGWYTKSHLQAIRACRYARVPSLVRGDSNSIRRRPWWIRLLHRIVLRAFSGALYVGEANRRFYVQAGFPENGLHFAPHAVDNAAFAAKAASFQLDRAAIRQRWSVPPNAFVFVFAGKLITKKRPLDLLSALARASAGSEVLHLIVAGTGELRQTCEAFGRERQLPVSFVGFLNQSEIARAYVAADCLVLPSDDGETWGLVVNEAMACGRPAIVSDHVGCHLDLVLPGETGYVFPLGDTETLAALMRQMAGRPEAVREMSERARSHVEARYSIEMAVRGTLRALRSVVPSARPAPETTSC